MDSNGTKTFIKTWDKYMPKMSHLQSFPGEDMEDIFQRKGLENTGIEKGKIVPLDGITEADKLETQGISASIVTVTSDYTLNDSDHTVLVDATAGAVSSFLPSAVGRKGKIFYFKKVDSSANNMTIDASGTETIDGSGTKSTATQYTHYAIQSDGLNWHIIG